jgi:hypothetical protein
MDFFSEHLEICGFASSVMAKLSCNINTDETKELVFNSDSEEQYTSL